MKRVSGPAALPNRPIGCAKASTPVAALSFVAVEHVGDTEVLRGSVRFWPIRVGGHEELLLGPLAVRGDQRGRGIGIG